MGLWPDLSRLFIKTTTVATKVGNKTIKSAV